MRNFVIMLSCMMLSSNLALSQTLIVFTYFDMVGEVSLKSVINASWLKTLTL